MVECLWHTYRKSRGHHKFWEPGAFYKNILGKICTTVFSCAKETNIYVKVLRLVLVLFVNVNVTKHMPQKCQIWQICGYQVFFWSSKYSKTRFRPGLRPGPRWGSLRRSPRPPSRLGKGTPSPHSLPPSTHSASRSRRLWRLSCQAPQHKFLATPMHISRYVFWPQSAPDIRTTHCCRRPICHFDFNAVSLVRHWSSCYVTYVNENKPLESNRHESSFSLLFTYFLNIT